MHVRLVFVPLPHLLVHEVFQAVLPVLLRFLSARSVTAWGHILTSAEEALQPHCKRDPIRSSHRSGGLPPPLSLKLGDAGLPIDAI